MEVTVSNVGRAERKYPWIGIAEGGELVLFVGDSEGVAVDNGPREGDEVGHYSSTWRMDAFTEFKGSVTLSND